MRVIRHCVFSVLFSVLLFSRVSAMPVPVESGRILLNGDWKLEVAAPERENLFSDFYKPGFPDAKMRKIHVPLNWEMAGFEDALYTSPSDNVGFYRKRFTAPAVKAGERVMLHFEGVLFGAEVWLNGTRIGSHIGGFTEFEFDVTGSLKPGAENILAVKVTKKRVRGYEFDCHDSWALSGIYRDVYLYKLPSVHVSRVKIETDLDEKYIDAELLLRAAVRNTSAETVRIGIRAVLSDPKKNSEPVSMYDEIEIAPDSEGKVALKQKINEPSKWTAETPVLYPLKLALIKNGKVISTTEYTVGFREVKVDGVRFLINGVPVKLRGVDRHETVVERGKALITKDWMNDIRLLKKGNINAIRTSHYPPDSEFLDLCDRYGLYVIDEAPFGHGDTYLNFPEYLDLLKDRVRETIDRDVNHPSVVVWSLGNENEWSFAHTKLVPYAHKLDSTRPVLLPKTGFYGAGLGNLPKEVDILAPHYPSPELLEVILRDQESKKDGRPVIMTEYLHSLGRQRLTRQTWDVVWRHESSAGGCVWVWADEGIKRPVNNRHVYTVGERIPAGLKDYLFPDSWLDDNHIIDSHGIYGADGIVNADRSLQPDFLEVKKIYSPIYFKDSAADVQPGQKTLQLWLQNRYDFTDLDGLSYDWQLLEDFKVLQTGHGLFAPLAPHEKGLQTVQIDFPDKIKSSASYILKIFSYDAAGMNIDVHQIDLKVDGKLDMSAGFAAAYSIDNAPPAQAIVKNRTSDTVDYETVLRVFKADKQIAVKQEKGIISAGGQAVIIISDWWKTDMGTEGPFRIEAEASSGTETVTGEGAFTFVEPLSVHDEGGKLRIGNDKFSVGFDKGSGMMDVASTGGRESTISGPALNTWRPLQLVEMSQPSFADYYMMPLLKNMKTSVRSFQTVDGQQKDSIKLNVQTFSLLADRADQGFFANYDYEIFANGDIVILYTIEPRIGPADLLELGVKFDLSPDFARMTVLGRGPDTYPGSIENTETSFYQKMQIKADSPDFRTNKTAVSWVSLDNGKQSIRFELPAADEFPGTQNVRGMHWKDKNSIYLNPWVKHPSNKNSDPPPQNMVSVKDGDVLKNKIIIHILGN